MLPALAFFFGAVLDDASAHQSYSQKQDSTINLGMDIGSHRVYMYVCINIHIHIRISTHVL